MLYDFPGRRTAFFDCIEYTLGIAGQLGITSMYIRRNCEGGNWVTFDKRRKQ